VAHLNIYYFNIVAQRMHNVHSDHFPQNAVDQRRLYYYGYYFLSAYSGLQNNFSTACKRVTPSS
jgi:hypothetical protein